VTDHRPPDYSQNLSAHEEHLHDLLEFSPAATAILDRTGRVIHFTASFTRIFGYTIEDIPHIDAWWPLAYPDPQYCEQRRHAWDAEVAQALAENTRIHNFEGLVRCKGGGCLWVEAHASFTESAILILLVDISKRKQAEVAAQRFASEAEAQRKQAAWLNLALESAQSGVWEWTLETNTHYWSPAIWRLFGLDEQAHTPNSELWETLIHPEDRPGIVAAIQEAVSAGKDFQAEYRLEHGGSLRWLQVRGSPAPVEAGQPRRYLGIIMDVTERRLAERTLRESSLRYQAIRETHLDGFWVVNLEGRILEVNDAYCQMSGYSREALEGLTIADLELDESREQTLQHIKYILEQGSDLFETRQRRKNGEIWHVEVSASFSPVDGGQIFAFLRDISERRRHQCLTELRQYLMELVRLGDQDQILRAALDVAEELTHSQIGFLHVIEADQDQISLQVWSTRTLAEMCFTESEYQHYPVGEAGVWADCIQQRQPVIHNNYAALPHKKGMPVGHAIVVRLATVPLLIDDRVVAVMGVGNKACDYTRQDVEILQHIIELAIDFTERQKAERQLEYIAYYDVLTGLPNRSLLMDRLEQAMAHVRRSNQFIAVCYLNLDSFKPINDRYGYSTGDALLVNLARRLQAILDQGDSLARLGGDEFAMILGGLASVCEGQEAVQNLLKHVNYPIEVQNHRLHISGSIGVTFFPLDHSGPDALLRHAHEAMYQAKGKNRSGYHLYDPAQDQQVRQRQQMREDFALALQSDQQLILYYQPKVDLSDGRVIGLEALIRWQHPREGLLAPGQFLPLIENTPLEIALGEWVTITALAQQQVWQEAGIKLAVSINISPRHIQMPSFVDFLARTLIDYPAGADGALEIEILEISEIDDIGNAAQVMNACKALGIHFALDDFGTGYSSLTYFHHLPIDIVKIDQHFVRDILDKNEALEIVEEVVRMAKALRRPVVAEGVESVEIGFMLLHLGCPVAQGYGIARPMPAGHVPHWLTEWEGNCLWRRLRQESLGSGNYDLNVALFSQRIFLDQVKAHLRGKTDPTLPPFDERQCAFGHWYHGIGQARYGTHPDYPLIQIQHHQIHRLAAALINQVAAGCTQESHGIVELDVLGDAINRELRKLEKA